MEASGKDQGINVRKKAQTLVALIKDKDKIREVRSKAAANRDKYALNQLIKFDRCWTLFLVTSLFSSADTTTIILQWTE